MSPAKPKITGDVQVLDDGKGVTLTCNSTDSAGNPASWPSGAVPTYAEVDPTGSTGPSFQAGVAGAVGANGTSYVFQVPLASPSVEQAGIQFNVTVPSGFQNQTAPITEQLQNAVDVVGDAASGFTVVASAS